MEIDNTIITAVVTTLSGCIAHLYKVQSNNRATTEKKLKVCEEKHEEVNRQMLDVVYKLGELRGADDLSRVIVNELKQLRCHNDIYERGREAIRDTSRTNTSN